MDFKNTRSREQYVKRNPFFNCHLLQTVAHSLKLSCHFALEPCFVSHLALRYTFALLTHFIDYYFYNSPARFDLVVV